MTNKNILNVKAIAVGLLATFLQFAIAQNAIFSSEPEIDSLKSWRAPVSLINKQSLLRSTGDTVLNDSTIYYQGDATGLNWEKSQKYIYEYNSEHLITTATYYNWDNVQNSWTPNYKETYTYDNSNRIIEYVGQLWNGSSWENDSREIIEYSSQFPTKVTKSTSYNWDNGTQQWIPSANRLYSYDAQGNRTEYISQTWDNVNNSWENNFRYIYTYDANNNRTKWERQNWNTGTASWEPQWRYLYVYNSSNQKTQQTYETYDAMSSAWVPSNRYNYTYNLQGLLSERVRQVWNSGTSSWDNASREVYTYNSQGLRTLWESFSWNGASWDPTLKREYQYDQNGNQTYYLRQSWNGASWDNNRQHFYVYLNNNLINRQEQTWDNVNGVWQNDRNYLYDYDENGNPIFYLRQLWNSVSNSWENDGQSFYAYDSLGYITRRAYEIWNSTDMVWNKDYRYDYFYSYPLILGIENALELSDLTMFPNPVRDFLIIEGESLSGIELIQIRDISGRLIRQVLVENNWLQIDVSNLHSGKYLVELYNQQSNKFSLTFIKQD